MKQIFHNENEINLLLFNRGSLRKWSKMQPGEIKFQNKSGGMWDPYPNLVHHPNIGPQHPPTLATPTGLPLFYYINRVDTTPKKWYIPNSDFFKNGFTVGQTCTFNAPKKLDG